MFGLKSLRAFPGFWVFLSEINCIFLLCIRMPTDIRRPSILPVPESLPIIDGHHLGNNNDPTIGSDGAGTSGDEAEDEVPWIGAAAEKNPQVVKGFPPVSPYIGVTPTLCYLLR